MGKDYTVQKVKTAGLKLLILRPTKAAKPRKKTPEQDADEIMYLKELRV